MKSQLQTLLFWVGAVLVIVLATIFYQPAAAKTGSLLVWTKQKIYVMDIDSLILRRVGQANADELIVPAPGCLGQSEAPCWVIAGPRLYEVSAEADAPASEKMLPGAGWQWIDSTVSWSPDGIHLAYSVQTDNFVELRVYNAATGTIALVAPRADPTIAVAWTAACRNGLGDPDCQIGYKAAGEQPLQLVALQPATNRQTSWEIAAEQIFELRWTTANELLYSQPQRHFYSVETAAPAFHIPPAGQLANMSPRATYTIYYQPFTLRDCPAEDEDACLHLGVWISERGAEAGTPDLIYNLNLAESQTGGLNFIPIWSADEKRAVFFQDGRLIHYDVAAQETTIWYKSVKGKLRSEPVFSPNEEAVAFVDNQGQGYSEYRLVIVNPKLQPIEHIIETKSGFRIVAWLPQ